MVKKSKIEKAPYDSCSVADFLINLAKEEKEVMSIMRLVKLAYLCHGWSLANLNRPLLIDPVQAWRYGPVIPAMYFMYRDQDKYSLTELKCKIENNIDNDSDKLIREVFGYYKSYNPYQLLALTHMKGSAWSKFYSPLHQGIVIPNKEIKKDFRNKLKGDD